MLNYQDLSNGSGEPKSVSEEEAIELIKTGKRVNIFGLPDSITQTINFLQDKDIKVSDMLWAKSGNAYCRINAPQNGSFQTLQAAW